MIDQLLFPQQSIYKKGVRSRQEFSNKSTGLGPYIMFSFFFVSLTTQRIKFNTSIKKEKTRPEQSEKIQTKKTKKGGNPVLIYYVFFLGVSSSFGVFSGDSSSQLVFL